MRTRTTLLVAGIVMGAALCAGTQQANAETSLNWWTSRTSVNNVYASSDYVRLGWGLEGSIAGMVDLPSGGTWRIDFAVEADESLWYPDDYVNVFINGDLLGTAYNHPASAFVPFSATVTGTSFTYNFEFTSFGDSMYGHQDIPFGTATPAPEPASLSLLALGGLAMIRRRRK